MTDEHIIEQFGDWIHEEDNEDGYGQPTFGTYWYCEVCDEAHGTPLCIEHSQTCSVGKGIKMAVEVERLRSLIAKLPCLDPVVSAADSEIRFTCLEWNKVTEMQRKAVCANCRTQQAATPNESGT